MEVKDSIPSLYEYKKALELPKRNDLLCELYTESETTTKEIPLQAKAGTKKFITRWKKRLNGGLFLNVQEPKELIDYLNATEPIQMLKDICGYPPTKLELMVIQDLECFYEFKKPVVNLILQYILKTNGGMLTINHLMHVAERVAINKIVTAEQAIRFFKSLNQDDIWISVEYEAYKPFMLTYMKEMNVTYKLKALILHEIVRYSRNQNQGYFIHWFTDKLIEYVAKNSVYEVEAVKALLENFHEKYIVPMGK